ncbi:class I SAM-dependent DNA methyltransferase [Candidatus Altiarchaeota archaeon]
MHEYYRGKCNRVKSTYDRSAGFYDFVMGLSRYNATIEGLFDSIEVDLPDNPNILDVGCGTGLASKTIMNNFDGFCLTGVDCSQDMLRIYSNRFPEARIVLGDFNDEASLKCHESKECFDLADDAYHMIISCGAVSEYGDLERILPLIHRILADDGVFINLGVEKSLFSSLSGRFWKYNASGSARLRSLLKSIGFSHVEKIEIPKKFFPSNLIRYIIKARK